jgi:hypothetical protein
MTALKLFRLLHGPGDGGSEREYHAHNPAYTSRLESLARRITKLEQELSELQETFDIRWNADMRAIKLWQKKTGRKNVWPDHVDLVVFLMERLESNSNHEKKL